MNTAAPSQSAATPSPLHAPDCTCTYCEVAAVCAELADEPTAVGRRHVQADDDAAPYIPALVPECDYGDASQAAEWWASGHPGVM